MAGRLPGVGLPPRKREHHHRHEHSYRDSSSSSSSSSSYLRETLNLAEAPCISLGGGGAAMDETALRARHRLQQKLGHFYSSFRYF